MKRLFVHRLFMTPLASYVGFAAMVYGAYALATGLVSLWWLALALPATFAILMGVTVGLHRLFCHNAFRTSTFWHVVLAYLGTLGIYGSTVQWCAMHISHHRWSDTPKDPHYTGWRYLFWKKNRPTEFHRKTLVRLYRNPLHRFMFKYYALVIGGTALALCLISPWALVFGYLIPLGWLHLVGSAHQVFAHNENGPQDRKWMEVLLFTGGEWLHGHHHARAGDPRFGAWDAGYQLIRAIETRRRATS